MGLFKKNPDPISGRSKALDAQISALEAKIKRLNQDLKTRPEDRPRLPVAERTQLEATLAAPPAGDPIFEKVDQEKWHAPEEPPATPAHFNELGVRKYDLFSLIDRIRRQFQSPPAANPKLVNYLAAGSIQGLRPLRYEKRVARNRFFALAVLLLLAFLGIFFALQHRH